MASEDSTEQMKLQCHQSLCWSQILLDVISYFDALLEATSLSPPVKQMLTVPSRSFVGGSFLLSMFCVCHAGLSVHCSLVVTYLERTNILALLYEMFSSVLSHSHSHFLGQVSYSIVSIIDLCLLPYLKSQSTIFQSCRDPFQREGEIKENG